MTVEERDVAAGATKNSPCPAAPNLHGSLESVSAASWRLTVMIPGPLPHELSPNARVHHQAKARAVRARRREVWAAVLDAHAGQPRPALPLDAALRYRVVVGLPKGGKRHDPDNMRSCLKSDQDQLCAMMGVTNDRHVRCVEVRQIIDPEGIGFVCYEIWREDGDADGG